MSQLVRPSTNTLTIASLAATVGLCIAATIACAAAPPHAKGSGHTAARPASAPSTTAPLEGSTVADAPVPPKATGNPMAGAKLWVNPHSQAAGQAAALKSKAPADAAIIARLAAQPSGVWLGEWSGDVKSYVQGIMRSAQGAMPVFVVYNLPYRDCGNYSKGGLTKADAYRQWIRDIQSGIGDGQAAVIVEPDALGLLDKCLDARQQAERLALIQDAVRALRQSPKVAVYLDAGHPHWVPAQTMAVRLQKAGIDDANGFALNTSNYVATDENVSYGEKLSGLVGGAHFVVDTSRNGNGSAPKDEWCNPAGRKIGLAPSTETQNPLADAWLWIKPPGESDGECNGGPSAGTFWVQQALQLAQ
jgi:endoglucanase